MEPKMFLLGSALVSPPFFSDFLLVGEIGTSTKLENAFIYG